MTSIDCNSDSGILVIVFFIFCLTFSFTFTYFVCDLYLSPFLIKLCIIFKLPPSVAGATLLSIGSSTPELLTSLSDVFFTQNNIGFGSIVGSSMFNNLFVIGLSLFFIDKHKCQINIKTFTRDIVTFIISVSLTTALIFLSDNIKTWSGFLMILFYILYILIMTNLNFEEKEEKMTLHEHCENDFFKLIIGAIMCVIVLSVISLSNVYMFTQIGCTLGINPMVMGIVFLAIGSSIPDIFVSIYQARQGNINTAIANAIGANIFDFFIGLGLPWFISNFFFQKPVIINEEQIFNQVAWAISTAISMLVLLSFSNNPIYYQSLGLVFILVYFTYVTYVINYS